MNIKKVSNQSYSKLNFLQNSYKGHVKKSNSNKRIKFKKKINNKEKYKISNQKINRNKIH